MKCVFYIIVQKISLQIACANCAPSFHIINRKMLPVHPLHHCILENNNEGSKLFVSDSLCDVCELV